MGSILAISRLSGKWPVDMLVLIILSNVGLITLADNLIFSDVIASSPIAFDRSSDLILVIKFSSVI